MYDYERDYEHALNTVCFAAYSGSFIYRHLNNIQNADEAMQMDEPLYK
jgi:hypothetical protein